MNPYFSEALCSGRTNVMIPKVTYILHSGEINRLSILHITATTRNIPTARGFAVRKSKGQKLGELGDIYIIKGGY